MRDKYLVFRLEGERLEEGYLTLQRYDCFELVKEFDIVEGPSIYNDVVKWANEYSCDHRLRTVVIKGTVCG